MSLDAPQFCSAATLFVVEDEDVPKAVAHYRDVLGFKMGFTCGDPVFCGGVERDDVTIHLQAAHKTQREAGQGAVNVFVTEVDALHDELRSRGATIVHPPGDRPYGLRDFDIDDLDGSRLTFGMNIGGSN